MHRLNGSKRAVLAAFVAAVDLAALAAILLLDASELKDDPLAFGALALLAAAVGTRSIRLPKLDLRVVASDAFVFCALVAFAPGAAPLVALASMVGVALGKNAKLVSLKSAFNLGAVPLSMAAGAAAFVALGGTTGAGTGAALPLLAAALVFGAVNVLLTVTAVSLGTGQSWIELCRRSLGLAWISGVTHALLGVALATVLAAVGPLGLAVGLVPLVPMEQYFRAVARRLQPAIPRDPLAEPEP